MLLFQMLHNKFGKEIGFKEGSQYSGLVKETKPRKKPVVAPSLGYKMKDLIEEALKASGNPVSFLTLLYLERFTVNGIHLHSSVICLTVVVLANGTAP